MRGDAGAQMPHHRASDEAMQNLSNGNGPDSANRLGHGEEAQCPKHGGHFLGNAASRHVGEGLLQDCKRVIAREEWDAEMLKEPAGWPTRHLARHPQESLAETLGRDVEGRCGNVGGDLRGDRVAGGGLEVAHGTERGRHGRRRRRILKRAGGLGISPTRA